MKIVIIGAGPAGLSCAHHYLKNNKKDEVILLEESDCVGGISKTISYHENKMDLGGHRFFTKNQEVLKLWFDILPLQGKPAFDDKLLGSKKNYDGVLDPEKIDEVMLVRNRVSRIYYQKKLFDYPVNFTFHTIRKMGLITTIKCGFSYLKALLFKKKEKNLEDFYINRFGKQLYEMFFKGYTAKLWGRTPSEIDSSWGSQRVKGISIRKVLLDYYKRLFHVKNKNREVSLTDYFYYPKYGPGEFYEEMAKRIIKMGGTILLQSKVTKIKRDSNHIKEVVYLNQNKRHTLSCDVLVSSMPMKDLLEIMNQVPKEVLQVAKNLPYRDFITIGVLVDHLDIKNDRNNNTIHHNISDNWIYIQDTTVKVGRIQIFNNWSPYLVKDPIHTIWIGMEYFCNEGDSFWNLEDYQLKKIASEELEKIDFFHGKVMNMKVIRVKKAYPAYYDSYHNISMVKEFIEGISNLYCIGRNGTHSYNNMDHSILSGMIASHLIQTHSHDLSKLWNVNVDKTYQEEK